MAGLTTRPEQFVPAIVVLPPVCGATAGRSRMGGSFTVLAGH